MKQKRICLDAGHYGEKYNAGVVPEYYESAIVWKLTQYEKEYLEKMGIEVCLTRTDINENPNLTERGKKALGCELFVSNHTNACGTQSVNRAVVIHLTEHERTLVDERSREFALQLAKVIQNTMGVNGYQVYSKVADNDRDGNGKKDDNYYGVLHGSFLVGVPGAIAEHSFHTNAATCKWLMDDSNLRKLAKNCAECMAAFVGVSGTVDDNSQEDVSENMYRVRKSWSDKKSQIGAYHNIEYAKATADENPGYSVYDNDGVRVYPVDAFIPYMVRVKIEDLNMRLGASIDTNSIGYIQVGAYTIVEEKLGKVSKDGTEGLWGRLKSEQTYNGKSVPAWICLSHTEKV